MKTIQVNRDIELRQIQLSDIGDIFYAIDTQRDYLGKWLPFVEYTKSVSDSETFVKSVIEMFAENQNYTFSIRYKDQFTGLIGFNSIDKINRCTEIGYWLCEQFQKKGIMTNSVRALCDFAFTEMQMNRIQINCGVENYPSKNIPERLGFVFEGINRERELLTGNKYTDIAVYSMLKREWTGKKQQETLNKDSISDTDNVR